MRQRVSQLQVGSRITRIVVYREPQFPFRLSRLAQIAKQVSEHNSRECEIGMRRDDFAQVSFDLIEICDRVEACFSQKGLRLEVARPQLKRALKTSYRFFLESKGLLGASSIDQRFSIVAAFR